VEKIKKIQSYISALHARVCRASSVSNMPQWCHG
jgi:hypothetical protein